MILLNQIIKDNFQAQSLTESVFSILGSYNRTTKSDSKSSTGVSSARSSLPDLTSPPESDSKFDFGREPRIP